MSQQGESSPPVWRLFELRVAHHPPYWMAWLIAVLYQTGRNILATLRLHSAIACSPSVGGRRMTANAGVEWDMPALTGLTLIAVATG